MRIILGIDAECSILSPIHVNGIQLRFIRGNNCKTLPLNNNSLIALHIHRPTAPHKIMTD